MREKLNCFVLGLLIATLGFVAGRQIGTSFAAAGDRKVVIQEIHISNTNPVAWACDWQLFIEDKAASNRQVTGGRTEGSFGSAATFNAMTGAQMRAAVKAAVQADAKVPTNDSVN